MSEKPQLELEVLPGFLLKNPLMIASSHLTANRAALAQLSRIRPAAVTLKTTSSIVGGDGKGERLMANVYDFDQSVIGIYSDGRKSTEFLDIPTTQSLFETARELLPESILGISVLQNTEEHYEELGRVLRGYDYVELNLKYSLRADTRSGRDSFADSIRNRWGALISDVERFCKAFTGTPVFIKLPRELGPLIPSREWYQLWDYLSSGNKEGARRGLIVANSLRCRVPSMFHNYGGPRRKVFSELSEGVLCGPALFPDTYDLIRRICEPGSGWRQVPVVASGGLVTIQSILDVLSAGAFAVQLCTALDIHSFEYYTWLLNQLTSVMDTCGVPSARKMIESLHFERDARASYFKSKAADLARTYPDHVRQVFEEKYDAIKQCVKQAITELSGLTSKDFTSPTILRTAADFKLPLFSRDGDSSEESFTPLRVISHTGHLAVHGVLTKLALASGGTPKIVPTSTDVIRELMSDVSWDLTMISYALANSRELQNIKEQPIFLGFLSDDPFKLIARHQDMRRVTTLYHFGGLNSRFVANRVMAEYPQLHANDLNPSALSYFLFSWPDEVAILLKEPLASIYGLVANRATHSLGTYSFPVCLVGSERFVAERGGELNSIYRYLRLLLNRASSVPDDFVALLYSSRLEDDLLRFILPVKAGVA